MWTKYNWKWKDDMNKEETPLRDITSCASNGFREFIPAGKKGDPELLRALLALADSSESITIDVKARRISLAVGTFCMDLDEKQQGTVSLDGMKLLCHKATIKMNMHEAPEVEIGIFPVTLGTP